MRHSTIIITLLFILTSAVFAQDLKLQTINILGMELDAPTIIKMLEKGEVGIIESNDDDTLKQATAMILINAPLKKVWEFVIDYEVYETKMHNVHNAEVYKDEVEDGLRRIYVFFNLEVPLLNYKYKIKHTLYPMERIEVEWQEGDLEGVRNTFYFFDVDGKRTIIVDKLFTPLKEQSWILRKIMKSNPSMEHSINISSALVILRGYKENLEKKGKKD